MFENLSEARKHLDMKNFRKIDFEMREIVQKLKSAESEVIKKLQEVDETKTYRWVGFNSLFQYTVQSLGLTEAQAYTFISVARKARECPGLQKAIDERKVTVSKASRVVSVMNSGNENHWLSLALTVPYRELEREVARENPRPAKIESSRFINDHELEMNVTVTEEVFNLIRRAQEILSQKRSKHVTMSETIAFAAEEFVSKNCPVKKAERVLMKKEAGQRGVDDITSSNGTKSGNYLACVSQGKAEITSSLQIAARGVNTSVGHQTNPSTLRAQSMANLRNKIPTEIIHRVYARDQGKCQYKLPHGQICKESKWVEIHHIVHKAYGGSDTLENLTTLCHGHHRAMHLPGPSVFG